MKIMALCTVDKEKLKKQKNLSAEANHENVIPEEIFLSFAGQVLFWTTVLKSIQRRSMMNTRHTFGVLNKKGTFPGGEDCGLKNFAEPDLLKR